MRSRLRPGVIAIPLVFIGLAVLVTGCRNYGGHGAEQATYDQIRQLHRVFGEELLRAQADFSALEQESAANDDLGEFAGAYGEIVRSHEASVSMIGQELQELSPGGDYRHLSRVYGAALARREAIQKQYGSLLEQAHRSSSAPDTSQSAGTSARVERPYSLIPPYYRRIQNAGPRASVNDVIAAARIDLPSTQSSEDVDLDTSVVATPIPSDTSAAEN